MTATSSQGFEKRANKWQLLTFTAPNLEPQEITAPFSKRVLKWQPFTPTALSSGPLKICFYNTKQVKLCLTKTVKLVFKEFYKKYFKILKHRNIRKFQEFQIKNKKFRIVKKLKHYWLKIQFFLLNTPKYLRQMLEPFQWSKLDP